MDLTNFSAYNDEEVTENEVYMYIMHTLILILVKIALPGQTA